MRIYTVEEARQTILKRTPPDDYEISERALERNRQIFGEPLTPEMAVKRILQSVRDDGDSAVIDWTQRIDGVGLDSLRIPSAEIEASLNRVPTKFLSALKFAAERIWSFHQKQRDRLGDWQEDGLGQLLRSIQTVGVYVPGGTAPLPSSLLMSAIPAQVAGVEKIIVCSPPKVPDIILAAAAICGIDEVYQVGGAQAIGAMAYGTQTVPAVDKIVGPGNLYVTLAKKYVYGAVGIDGILGPTETMVIADDNANPAFVAADMLAQAEHDVLASAILVTTSRDLAEKVSAEIGRQIEDLTRAEIIGQSLPNRGGAVFVSNMDEAFEVANAYGAEHLCLAIENPLDYVDRVKNAGGIFVGEQSFEVLGDYVAGPSHVMPTSGTARFASPLNVLDFLKVTSLIALDQSTAAMLSEQAAILADAESLDAHAASAEIRLAEAENG
jgi:histidinol dehydrogenase